MDFDKKEVIEDLIELKYYQGYHCGRWENEQDREDSAEEYLKKMKEFAEKYNIQYDDDLNNYADEDDWLFYKQDEMGCAIKDKLEEHLTNLLLGC